MIKDSNFEYQIVERTRWIEYGRMEAIHELVCKVGLDRAINESLKLLKAYLPFHESEQVLNIAYNVMSGGTRLEDTERTAGDFLPQGSVLKTC